MVTRREFIQASTWLGGVAIGRNSFSPLRAPGKDSAAINPTVTTALGKLRGRYANGVYSFKGVHYGASTEGRLRFRPPVPAKPWVGIRMRTRLDRRRRRFSAMAILGRPFRAREDERRLSCAQCLDTRFACPGEKAGVGLAPRRRLRSRFWRSGPL